MPALAVVPRGGERMPIRVLLPGRDVAFEVCHARGAWETCDKCLWAIAEALAAEMKYSLAEALNRPGASYGAELGGHCSDERAYDLALMTQSICYRHVRAGSEASAMFVAGLDARVRAAVLEMPRAQSAAWKRWAWVALVFWLAVVVVAVWFFRGAR